MEAWFQAAAASVDVRDTDSARMPTTAWSRLNSSCTQLRYFRPWTRMLPFVQYRCMTSCFRSPWCSLAVVWHSSAGMADTHGHPLSSLVVYPCRGVAMDRGNVINVYLARHFASVLVTQSVKTRGHVTDHKQLAALDTLQAPASRLCRTWLRVVVSGPCTKLHNSKDAMTENSFFYTDKLTVSGQITTKVPYAESLEAYPHILIFFDSVAALVQCKNTQNVGAKTCPCRPVKTT